MGVKTVTSSTQHFPGAGSRAVSSRSLCVYAGSGFLLPPAARPGRLVASSTSARKDRVLRAEELPTQAHHGRRALPRALRGARRAYRAGAFKDSLAVVDETMETVSKSVLSKLKKVPCNGSVTTKLTVESMGELLAKIEADKGELVTA